MANNKLYEDSELKDIKVKKVKDIKKVAITNDYNDLNDIPKLFNPKEHTDMHPVANENQNGMLGTDTFKKLNNYRSYIKINMKQTEKNNTSRPLLNATEKSNDINIIHGSDMFFIVDEDSKELIISAVEFDTSKLIMKKGEIGEKGENGKDGGIYKPTLDSKGNLSWEFIPNPTETEYKNYNYSLNAPKGLKGIDGRDGKPLMVRELLENPFNGMQVGTILLGTGKIGEYNPISLAERLRSDVAVVNFIYEKHQFVKDYGNVVKYLYVVYNDEFYTYDSNTNEYSILDTTATKEKIFSISNQFLIDTVTKALYYVNEYHELLQI